MPYTDLQHFLVIKLIFFLCLAVFLFGVYRTWRPWVFLLIGGVASAAAYLVLTNNLALLFWGLTGDEVTIAAMYETFAHKSLFADFGYHELPPFYPALFFQLVALVGRFFDWHGVVMTKVAAAGTMMFFPVLLYGVQRWYWNKETGETKEILPGFVASFLATIFVFLFIDWDAVLIKPYELVSAALLIVWAVCLFRDHERAQLSFKRIVVYGVSGGLLFLVYYFWFFLLAIGLTLAQLFSPKRLTFASAGRLLIVAAIVLIIGALYFLPVAQSYQQFGSENWQLGFFVPKWIATTGPMLEWSLRGVFMMLGFVGLIVYRKEPYMRVLLALFVAGYVWQIMGISTILAFASPLQESKGFYFFTRLILAFAAGFILEQLLNFIAKRVPHIAPGKTLPIIAVLFITPFLFFGTFVDYTRVTKVRERSRSMDSDVVSLATFLRTYPLDTVRVLDSGIPHLYALVPINHALYFNQHNSHPAALFSARRTYLSDMTLAKSAKTLHDMAAAAPFGSIDLFVFYKKDANTYPVFYHEDNFPFGLAEKQLLFSKSVFTEPFFTTVFENNSFVVLQRI